MTMAFKFGTRSEKELAGVKPQLVAAVRRALVLSPVDFSVHDGLRTLEEQKKLLASGASTTLNSKHLSGDAVDLVPYVGGKLRWEWPLIYPIAEAMRKASQELGVPLRWGGAWDQDFTFTDDSPEDLVNDYVARRRKRGLRAFIDGPHFELN